MSIIKHSKPSGAQCDTNEKVFEGDDCIGHAVWYPQMGGHVGCAIAFFDKGWKDHGNGTAEGGCVDVAVWHDGEFPFSDEDGEPHWIHHCAPEQFIEFGKVLLEINNRHRIRIEK